MEQIGLLGSTIPSSKLNGLNFGKADEDIQRHPQGLVKIHEKSLVDESIRTLLVEVEVVVNSRPMMT